MLTLDPLYDSTLIISSVLFENIESCYFLDCFQTSCILPEVITTCTMLYDTS